MRARLLALILLAFAVHAAPALAQEPARPDGGRTSAASSQPAARRQLSDAILAKWRGHVRETYGVAEEQWTSALAPTLAAASPEQLQRALNAPTFVAMNDELLRGDAGRQAVIEGVLHAGSPGTAARIGDAATDLVFVPITPCRIFDTRLAGGPIPARATRHFDVNSVGDFSFQGGQVGDCGVGDGGSFAAAMVNLTVVTPAAAGYLTAFAYLGVQPLTATIVYSPGAIVGNLAAVKLDQGPDPYELSIFSFAEAHVVGDLVGYFTTPQATALECVQTSSATNDIAAGASGSALTLACPAGYSLTGGGCVASSFETHVVTARPFPSTYFCAFNNQGPTPAQVTAIGQCCRVPGR